ncbi:YcnI family protein [Arthrobacter sp. H14-L1]|uniref:YcnI family copper-binding membrane protein n=1 Tax=Arthrobacter sp. H14-L1 TaxID=2996697 RepID=UPI00226E8AF6|nr:YcnI family protein [Arthrobacter sp. H14-L1]MCY0905596.1 YcnI family protein [Arthrobacter sp. H14-L1]
MDSHTKNTTRDNTPRSGKTRRRALKATLIAGATIGLMTAGLSAASAHVDISPDSTAAGSYSLLTFSVGHGCNGSPTTKMTIDLPKELSDATPTVNPNWTISKTTEKLATPQKLANGSSVTERTSQIIYTAKTPLDAHQRDALALSLQLPDKVGETLYFPTLQTCETGETNWVEVAAAGQDPESLKAPAPLVTVTAAQAAPSTTTAAGAASGGGANVAGADTGNSDSASQAPGWIGLAAGVLGLGMGGVALARTRKPAAK